MRMKTTITLLTGLLFAGMMLPSCGITIVKRQHTGGYYVSTNHRYHADKGDVTIKRDENKSVASPQSTVAEVKAEESEVAEVPATIDEPINTVNAPAIEERNDEAPAGAVKTSSAKRTPILSSMTEKVPLAKKMDSTVKKVKSKFKPNAPAGDDELSLLWIVILVLLVLWALGLIGGGWGLGWAINVLLVIALVLLILWLLRVL